ncbi:MAG: DUF819 family protein [Myxococcota bacterium]
MIGTVLQVLVLVLVPAAALYLEKRVRLVGVLGAVAVCYLIGFAIGNTPGVSVDPNVAMDVSTAAVALAIPLLSFSLDFVGWLRLAPRTVLAFSWAVLGVCVATAIAAPMFADRVPESAKVAGMLVGVYTGGTPNLAAVGKMLGVSSETFVMVNAADVMVSAPYFLFLVTFGPKVFLRFLRASEAREPSDVDEGASNRVRPVDVGMGLVLAIMAVAVGVFVSGFAAGAIPEEAVAILVITTVAIAFSFHPRVRALEGTFEAGNYILLVFCVAIGIIADFAEVVRSSLWIVAYVTVVVVIALTVHLVLCRVTRVDRDTTIITSTAALFGPAFIGPVAVRLGNRDIFVSGLMSGLVGYAVGNYLGLFVAWLLGGLS